MKNLHGKTITNPDLGDIVTFLHTKEESGGEKTVLDITLQPGGGNALHFHKAFEETFEVLEGELMVQLGKENRKLTKGEKVTVPKGAAHRFYSKSDKPSRFLVILNPGHTGFENSLAIGYGLAGDGLTVGKGIPKKIIHLAILASISDTHGPGIWKIFTRFFQWLANSPKAIAEKDNLIDKYC